jgi:hypothetical protein
MSANPQVSTPKSEAPKAPLTLPLWGLMVTGGSAACVAEVATIISIKI